MNIVITGASKGLGKAMAEIFASNGHALYLCSRSEEALNETANNLRRAYTGSLIKTSAKDLSKKEAAEAFGEWVLNNGVIPDILINNAGRFVPGGIINEAPGTLEELMNTNLYSAYHLTRTLLPEMIKRKMGHIFNICSIASFQAYKDGGAYSISKFALHGFSKNLREELKPHNIKVTSVFPGAAYTNSWSGSGINPQRIMEAADVAKTVYAASQLSPQACVEEIVLRPILGDL